MIVIAGNTPVYNHAKEPHQGIRFHADASQGDIYRPICKRVWRIDDAKWLPDVMSRALNVAQTGRPGAVLLDVPMDVFSAHLDAEVPCTFCRRPRYEDFPGSREGIEAAAEMLLKAQRPVIFAGNGVLLAEASEELKAVAELLNLPVATTLMGKGLFPEDHPLALGVAGIWGTTAANDTTREADCILAVGTGFAEADTSSWRPEYTFAIPPSRLIQIDIDPQEIGKIYPAEVGIVGHAKSTLRELDRALREKMKGRKASDSRLAEIKKRKDGWSEAVAETQRDDSKPIHPARLLRDISHIAGPETVFVTDVGWNKNGAGQQLRCLKPGSFITSGGMATMGFAPAAAIGVKIGAPGKKVVCLVGDGGLLSVVGALTTAVELNIPVLWIVFNNFCFSTIRTVGVSYFNNRYATEFARPDGTPYNPDFPAMAQSFGIQAARVDEPEELPSALKTAFAADCPYLLEVRTRGDVPMPRTGYWDIADFLAHGND
jgi:acetolactate synthase-1/2/3 large subunit